MRPAPPPGNLAQQSLPLQLFAAPVFRLWQNHHPSAFFWSKKGIYRFDSKSARYGVLYTGGTLEGAALEVFGDQRLKRRASKCRRSHHLIPLSLLFSSCPFIP